MIDMKKIEKLERIADDLNELCFSMYKEKSTTHSQNFFLNNAVKQILKVVDDLKGVQADG